MTSPKLGTDISGCSLLLAVRQHSDTFLRLNGVRGTFNGEFRIHWFSFPIRSVGNVRGPAGSAHEDCDAPRTTHEQRLPFPRSTCPRPPMQPSRTRNRPTFRLASPQ